MIPATALQASIWPIIGAVCALSFLRGLAQSHPRLALCILACCLGLAIGLLTGGLSQYASLL